MRQRDKWVWILTLLNVFTAVLVMLVIWAMLSVIGIAAEVSSWPLFASLSLGGVLSLTGVLIAKGAESRVLRRLGCVVNGSTLAFYSTLLVGIAALFIGVPQERFLVPKGFMGDVYVIHNIADGEPEVRTLRRVTYRIPRNGILRTQAPMNRGFTWSVYYYERNDGGLEQVRNTWNTTIQRTTENLTNNKDVGVFFPRTGTGQYGSAGCPIEFEEFSIGTKAYLLSDHPETNLTRYLNEHPVKCGGSTH